MDTNGNTKINTKINFGVEILLYDFAFVQTVVYCVHFLTPQFSYQQNGICCFSFIFWTKFSIWSSICTKQPFENDNNKQLTVNWNRFFLQLFTVAYKVLYVSMCFNRLNDIGNNCFWLFGKENEKIDRLLEGRGGEIDGKIQIL